MTAPVEFPVQCPAVYDRIRPDDTMPTHVQCTYLADHPGERHSWETLRLADEAARETLRASFHGRADLPEPLNRLLNAISTGGADAYLELLLAAAHDRKRARRGTYGFPRRTA